MFDQIANTLNKIRNRPLVWDTVTTTLFSTIGKGIGFLIPFFIAAWFGVSKETDAFFFAYGLIIFLSGIFATVIESVIVPYIAEMRAKGEEIGDFIRRVLGTSGLGLFILAGLFLIIIKPILGVITRFDSSALNLIGWLLAETAPLVILIVWTSVLAGALNAYKKFVFPALSPAFRAIINLAVIFAFKDSWGVHAIAWGYVFGEIVRLFILASAIHKTRLFSLRFSLAINTKLKEFIKTASYQIGGMIAVGFNPIVDKTMASWLEPGSVSILEYADRLYTIPTTFISTGLMVTLLSYWSERFYQSGKERFNRDIRKVLMVLVPMILVINVGLILLSHPIVKIAFGRGEFPLTKLPMVQEVWIYYLLGFLPYLVGTIYIEAHLVLKNTAVILKLGILNALCKIVLNFLFMRWLHVSGIAMSTTVTCLIITILLIVTLKRKLSNG